ncbi:hypothetical protein [Sphingopyxis sp. JAI108]|uniref:hypothetical protein n=1 Tax=Sphingopyxis sp. JAI108 TaxID=2723060 RepID=UPI0015C6E798|nr:hypothetical protein [Sphingopyxis sp. JAI108]NYF30615.1 hypothetical protein [Sphingopyxis sp. JAI108]
MRLVHVIALSILAVAATPAFASADSPAPPSSARAPEIRLPSKTVTLPIVMVREFPFIEGEIAGVKGKLMLDTGMQDGLVINDHRVPLTGGTKIGTGHFGSGQAFDIRLHAAVPDIRVGNLRHPRATNVRSQDARMLEKIAPDFLGWVGFNFFADHAIKIDYRRLEVTFYEAGDKSFIAGEKVIAILPFETRKLPNIPVLPARIGDLDAIVTLDTGMYGSLNIPEEKKAGLIASGLLKPASDPDAHDLSGVRLADMVDGSFPALEVEEGPSPSAKSVGITEDTELELGFVFLGNYKTVWDYRQKRIYLLAP